MKFYAVLAAVAALVLFAAISCLPSDWEFFAYLLGVAPVLIIASLALGVHAIFWKNRRCVLGLLTLLAIFWLGAISFFNLDVKYPVGIRSTARWLVWSSRYKSEVLAQPAQLDGEFRHIEWDGWGMFAQDTSVFLVYDPEDSLAQAARSGRRGKFDGIPCEVPSVRRLEPRWYAVVFYTNEYWGSCG